MIARILSRLADLRDARELARTVHVQADQIDALTVLAAHLEAALEVAETAAEEYRARLHQAADVRDELERAYRNGDVPPWFCAAKRADGVWCNRPADHASTTPHHRGFQNGEVVTWLDPPRDAATLENRVLSLCQGWAADRERDTAARLTAAEVELAAVRAEAASLRREICETHARLTEAGIARLETDTLLQRVSDLTAQRDGARGRADRFERMLTEARAQVEGLRIGLEAVVERARRWERHARALARVAHMAVGMMGPARIARARDWLADIRAREGRDDTAEHDAPPPPTTRSPRAAAAPLSPPRFRAAAGGDR